MFTAALFTPARKLTGLKFHPLMKDTDNVLHRRKILSSVTKPMDLEVLTLSEISKAQVNKYHIISLGSRVKNKLSLQKLKVKWQLAEAEKAEGKEDG